MTTHPALQPDPIRRLRAALGGPADTASPAAPARPVGARAAPPHRLKRLLETLVRRAVGWYVDRALEANVADVRRMVDEIHDRGGQLAVSADIELLKAELAALDARLAALEGRGSGREYGDG